MNLELFCFGHAAGTYPVTFFEQRSFPFGVVFASDFMADLVADRLTLLAVAPLGDLNVLAAIGEHDESSKRILETFWIWLRELKKVSSSRAGCARCLKCLIGRHLWVRGFLNSEGVYLGRRS